MPIRDPLPVYNNGTVYFGQFQTTWEGVDTIIIIKIAQKSTFTFGTLSYLATLNDERDRLPEGALVIKTVDNDDDPLTPIKAKEATIKLFSGASIKSFAKGESDEWTVTIYSNVADAGHLLFQGFLVMDVASEPYEPKPFVVTLTATDNLGLLKNIALTDFDGNNPKGENKIIKYLAWALSKTNMSLPIYVSNNLMEENNPGITFYESCYLHAKTFEKELTSGGAVSEDCYTVITKILGNDSRITQRNGAWWIERIYEKNANPSYVHQFDYDGTYIGVAAPAFYKETIDFRGLIDFVNDNAQVTIKSPNKKAELTYNYDFPREIVDNIDFSRGTPNLILAVPPVVIDGVTYYQSKFNIADWTALQTTTGTFAGTGTTSTTNNYIRRLFSDINRTYEVERYVVIEGKSPAFGFFLKSNKVIVKKNDKFDISVDSRFSADVFPSSGPYTIPTMQIRLTGKDGSHYTLHGGEGSNKVLAWQPTNSTFSTTVRNFYIEGNYTENMADWKTSSFITDDKNPNPFPPIPVDGYIEILLLHGVNANLADRYFNNLRFTYIPFINGGYSKYSSEKHTVSQSGNYSNSVSNPIYINNAPNQLMKGALLIKVGSNYELAGRFYDGQAFPGTTPSIPSDDYYHPFAYQLVYAIWQLFRRHMGSIDGDMVGLKCGSPLTVPDLYKVFLFTNTNPHVDNKYFMLLHYEQDFDSQIWRAYFTEILDTMINYVFTDPYEFKYITG